MRKTRYVAIVLVISMFFCSSVTIANQPIRVTINGQALVMDVQPIIRDGRTLVPFRAIFEALGANPHWDAATGQITAWGSVRARPGWSEPFESRAVLLYINSRTAWRGHMVYSILKGDGEQITLDTPPVLIGGRTMVPLRFIAESFDVKVDWDANTRTVSILTETSPPMAQLPLTIQPPTTRRQRMTSQEVTAYVRPTIVRIDTHRGHGSGFFVSRDGLVLTNAHVVRGSRQIVVTTETQERFSATIYKIANWHDLALLRINAPSQRMFPYLTDNLAFSHIELGEEVLAFGSPLGLTGTVTRGIVSAWQSMDVTMGGWKDNVISVIQHDAALAPGNSGGPIVNLYGEWIGVNTLVRADWAGFGFAVPADRYYELVDRNHYSLWCDWSAFYTESWIEGEIDREIDRLSNKAVATTSIQERVTLVNQIIMILQEWQSIMTAYQPLYSEVQHVHRLQLLDIKSRIAFYKYFIDVTISPISLSLNTLNMLSDNAKIAHYNYVSARNDLQASFR